MTTTNPLIALLSPAVGTPNVGDYFIELAVRRLLREETACLRFSTREALNENAIQEINGTQCAILCGTNLYQHDWHSALTPDILSRLSVPVIPFGVGGSAASLDDRSVSLQTGSMIRALHQHCVAGGVRDPFSAQVVSDAGVTNAMLTGCPVLFWSQEQELSRMKGVRRRRLIVTARNWLMHRWPDNVNHPVQIAFLRELLASFKDDEVIFAVHEDWDEELADRVPIPSKMMFRSEQAEDYVRLYSDSDAVVLAMRLHAGMFAVANGVPALFVGHDTRTYSFCEMMGLDWVELFEVDAAKDAIRRLRALLEGDVTAFDGLRPRYHDLRISMERFMGANSLPGRWCGGAG